MKKNRFKSLLLSLMISLQPIYMTAQESLLANNNTEDAVEEGLSKILGTIITVIGSIYVKILAIVCCTMIGIRLIISKNIQEAGKKFTALIVGCLLVCFTPDISRNIFKMTRTAKQFQTISILQPPSSFGTSKENSKNSTKNSNRKRNGTENGNAQGSNSFANWYNNKYGN